MTAEPGNTPPDPLASWPARAGAFGVDVMAGLAVVAAVGIAALTVPQYHWLWWCCVTVGSAVLLAIVINRFLLPTLTGWSLGRSWFGIAVIGRDGVSGLSDWRLLIRDIAHLLDTSGLFLGWLWPLWDSRHRTWADILVGSEVRQMRDGHRNTRRWASAAVAAGAIAAASATVATYLEVSRQDQATLAARAEIAARGPNIVEELLSYDPRTLQADFARARSVVTDTYRPQLVAQQKIAQQAQLVTNEYWVTNSAVLSVTPDEASMLLLMQGQRGAPPKQRFISATVRVRFENSTDLHWRVADLTILTKPQSPAGS